MRLAAGAEALAAAGAECEQAYPGGTKISLDKASNTITVGTGVAPGSCLGAGGCSSVEGSATITSAGGGRGDGPPIACTTRANSRDGGAGGGGTSNGPNQPTPVGQGNVPPVSPPQGANGGSKPYIAGGGGGGGGASGGNGGQRSSSSTTI